MAFTMTENRPPNTQKIKKYLEKYPLSKSKDVECIDNDRGKKNKKQRREHNERRKKIKLSSSIGENNDTDKKAEALPLVYTTRLDDMIVLSDSQVRLENNPNLLKDIEAESKPTFSIKSLRRKRKHPECENYYLLNRKLQNYFSIRINNDEYVDTKNSLGIKEENNVRECESSDAEIIEVVEDRDIVEILDSDDEPLPQFTPNNKQDISEQNQTNPLKLKNLKHTPSSSFVCSEEPYVAMLRIKENLNVVFSYKNHGNPSTLVTFKQCDQHIGMFKSIFAWKPAQIIYKCCWYRLFHSIRLLSFLNFYTHYHECRLENCRCCCIKKFKTDPIQDDTKNIKDQKSVVVQEETKKYMECLTYQLRFQLLEKRRPSQIMKKALCNTLSVRNVTTPFRNPLSKQRSCTKSQKSAVTSRTYNTYVHLVNEKMKLAESYTISPTGDVIDYSNAPSYRNEGNIYRNEGNIKPARQLYSKCCCTCRNNMISKILFYNKTGISPGSVRFMNRLHKCYHESFDCCCVQFKKVKKVNVTLNSEILDLTDGLRKFYLMSDPRLNVFFAELNEMKAKAEIDVPIPLSEDKIKRLEKRNRKKKTNYLDNDQPNLTRISISTSKMYSSSVVYPRTAFYSPANMNNSVANNALSKVNRTAVTKAISQFNADIANQVLKAIDQVPEAQAKKTAICQLFRNMRVTVDGNGKAIASLYEPLSSLPCAELDVLSNLLNNAQEAADKSVSQLCNDVTYLPIQSNQKYGHTNEPEKLELIKKCSVTSAGNSEVFKPASFDEESKESLEKSTTMMPIIDNVFSLNQDQKHDAMSHDKEPTPGPSSISENGNPFKINDIDINDNKKHIKTEENMYADINEVFATGAWKIEALKSLVKVEKEEQEINKTNCQL